MKKIIFAVLGFVSLACSNPSIEEGLANMKESLAQLEAQLAAVDVDQMILDLNSIQDRVEVIETDIIEGNGALAEAVEKLAELRDRLLAVNEILENAATAEQVAAIKEKLVKIREQVNLLVLLADYDNDGVINGLDQCPDTELGATVDSNGCADGQTAG